MQARGFARASRGGAVGGALEAGLAAILLSCSGGGTAPPAGTEVPPNTEVVIEEGPARLHIPSGEHVRVSGEGPVSFYVDVEVDRSDAEVGLASGEVLLGPMVTISQDQAGEIPIAGSAETDPWAALELTFDGSLLPEGVAAHDLNVMAKVRYPGRLIGDPTPGVDDMVTEPLVGRVDAEAGVLTLVLSALPTRSDVAVVFTPNLAALSDVPGLGQLSREPPWRSFDFHILYDRTSTTLVAGARAQEGSSDEAAIARYVYSRVVPTATAVAEAFSGLGLREPALELRRFNAPGAAAEERWIIHLHDYSDNRSRYDPNIDSSPFPRILLDVDEVAGTVSPGLTFTMAHEMHHAVFAGYAIPWMFDRESTPWYPTHRGFDEGLATTVGMAFHTATAPTAVFPGQAEVVFDLDARLGTVIEPYSSQDFFAYLARAFTGDTLSFLTGDDGLLDQMRTSTEALLQGDQFLYTTTDDYYRAYYRALDNTLRAGVGPGLLTLNDAFDQFIRNRFYEHDAHSRLYTADADAPLTPRVDRFKAPLTIGFGAAGSTVVGIDLSADIDLPELPSMSARLIVVEADGGYSAPLTVEIDLLTEYLLPDGVRVTVYPEGAAGTSLAAPHYVDASFGTTHQRLFLLIVNTSMEAAAQINVTLTAGTGETSGLQPCPSMPGPSCPAQLVGESPSNVISLIGGDGEVTVCSDTSPGCDCEHRRRCEYQTAGGSPAGNFLFTWVGQDVVPLGHAPWIDCGRSESGASLFCSAERAVCVQEGWLSAAGLGTRRAALRQELLDLAEPFGMPCP